MFRNTLTANDKYPFRDWENMLSPIQMQLTLNNNPFSDFLLQFLESRSNLEHFEKKDGPHTYFTTDIRGCERLG